MRQAAQRFAVIPGIIAVGLLAGCGDATAPSENTILLHRASWSAQHLSDYSYIYEATGFFINTADKPISITVRNNAVASAVFAGTGDPVPGSPTNFPTIDQLFDQALAAARNHSLTSITFDPNFGYPSRMDLAGPPDASGSLLASQLEAGR